METEQATVETTDVGSNEEGFTPESEDSPSSENQTELPQEAQGEETLPFGKHPRWQKMSQANRELKEKVQTYETQARELEGAVALKHAVSSNPAYARLLQGILQGQDPQALLQELMGQNKDPYEDYEPDVAERFRKLDSLEKWKAEKEQERVAERQATVDREFDSILKKDGYLDDSGKPLDQKIVDVIGNGVIAWLMNNSQTWPSPSVEELHYAYKEIKDGLSYIQNSSKKQALKNIVKTDVPASGSRQGAPPSGKGARTDHDRIMDLANSL